MNPRSVWIPCRGPLADYWISGYIITPMSPVTGLLLAALGAAFSSAPPPASAVVERVVAVIRPPASAEARVVTLTRVEDEVRIALVSSGAALAATQPLDAPALRAGLEWLVDQMLLSEEAARLQGFEIEGGGGGPATPGRSWPATTSPRRSSPPCSRGPCASGATWRAVSPRPAASRRPT